MPKILFLTPHKQKQWLMILTNQVNEPVEDCSIQVLYQYLIAAYCCLIVQYVCKQGREKCIYDINPPNI